VQDPALDGAKRPQLAPGKGGAAGGVARGHPSLEAGWWLGAGWPKRAGVAGGGTQPWARSGNAGNAEPPAAPRPCRALGTRGMLTQGLLPLAFGWGGVSIFNWNPNSPSLFTLLASPFAREGSKDENKKGFHESEVKRGWKERKSSLNTQVMETSSESERAPRRGGIPPPRLPLHQWYGHGVFCEATPQHLQLPITQGPLQHRAAAAGRDQSL